MALSGSQHEQLHDHLYPCDGLEAAAILCCRIEFGEGGRILVRNIKPVPLDKCVRTEVSLTWPGEAISEAIDEVEDDADSLFLVHSHPGGSLEFSNIDDKSDREVIPQIFAGWSEASPAEYHGSAIMDPHGVMRARVYDKQHVSQNVDLVNVIGDEIRFFWSSDTNVEGSAHGVQPFFDSMAGALGRLSVAIVGVSGTGSIVAEQAARMGFGELVLIDFDNIEEKNLNRILNSKLSDAQNRRPKVEIVKEAIEKFRTDCLVRSVPFSISERHAVLEAASCDVLFCCVDSLEGRHVVDQLAQAMLLPLFDVGVTIPTRLTLAGEVTVADALGRVDYVQPGRSTLRTREVYGPESLRAEYLANADPDAFRSEAQEGYVKGAQQEAPSVISLNMRAASSCMLEFIARTFPYRHEPNADYARSIFSLASMEEDYFSESSFEPEQHSLFATGLREPLLGMPAL